MSIWLQIISRGEALHAGKLQVDFVVPAIRLVHGAVIGSIGIHLFDVPGQYLPCSLQGPGQEAAVGSGNHLHAGIGDQVQNRWSIIFFLLLIARLGEVHRVALHLVAILVTVVAIGIVRGLGAVGADLIILQGENDPVFPYRELFLKNSLKSAVTTIVVSLEEFYKTVHQLAQCHEPGVKLCLRAAINHLVARFIQDALYQGEFIPREASLEDVLLSLPDEQAKGLVDQLVAGVPGNVAADELAVHAHLLATDVELEQLVPGDLCLTGLEQVLSVFSGIFHQVTPEQVVGRRNRRGILEGHQSQGASHQEVEVAVLEQLLVAPALTLFQDHHPHQHPQGSVGSTFSPGVKHAEDGLVHAHHDLFPELVMPGVILEVIVLRGVFKILGG